MKTNPNTPSRQQNSALTAWATLGAPPLPILLLLGCCLLSLWSCSNAQTLTSTPSSPAASPTASPHAESVDADTPEHRDERISKAFETADAIKGETIMDTEATFVSYSNEQPSREGELDISHRYQYQVRGKNYKVFSSADSFQEVGIASWYGPGFHGKKTANGEIYDMHEMTAAHKTLPLGSLVKVRRLSTGDEIIVRINDRGPFHKGRIIDLSKAAAAALGIIKKGAARVHVKAITD